MKELKEREAKWEREKKEMGDRLMALESKMVATQEK